jgi:hypothetical protein
VAHRFALHDANRLLRPIFAETNFSGAKLFIFLPAGYRSLETLAMFKPPAYDPFAICFGVAIVAVIALVF